MSLAFAVARQAMHGCPWVALVTLVLLAVAGRADAAGPPSIQGLGTLHPENPFSNAIAISDDGSAVTGNTTFQGEFGIATTAYRWRAGVMTAIGDLPGGGIFSEAGGISADGAVVSGMSLSANGTEAFRWENGVIAGLGDLPGGSFYSHGFGVSGDGTSVVGLSRIETGDHPFRWRESGMIDLGQDAPAGEPAFGHAIGVSYDGNVVVGFAGNSVVGGPFRWQPGLMQFLPSPPGIAFAIARAVSPDGQFVVGHVRHSNNPFVDEAVRWHGSEFLLLGDLPGGSARSVAYDVSADGNVVVGSAAIANSTVAFIWTPRHGMRPLRDLLTDDFNLDLSSWQLGPAVGVSADGRSFAGNGNNLTINRPEAWLAHIGCTTAGDLNNDTRCDGADISWFVRCLVQGLGCGCADMDGDDIVGEADLLAFVAKLLED